MKPTLRLKIVTGFLVATVVTLALGAVAAALLSNVKERSEISSRTSLDEVSQVADIQAEYLESQSYGSLSFYGPPGVKEPANEAFLAANARATEKLIDFGKNPMSADTAAAYKRVAAVVSWFNKLDNEFLGTHFPVLDPTVPSLSPEKGIADYFDHQAEMRDSLAGLRASIDRDATAARNEANAAADKDLRLLLVALAVVGVALIGFAVWVSGRLVKRLRETVAVLQRVADGDLTARAPATGHDEVGDMATALNTSVSTMHDVLCQIGDDAETLASVAKETRAKLDRVAAATPGDGATPATTGEVAMASSDGSPATGEGDDATKLADMAENLNDVLGIFVLDRHPTSV